MRSDRAPGTRYGLFSRVSRRAERRQNHSPQQILSGGECGVEIPHSAIRILEPINAVVLFSSPSSAMKASPGGNRGIPRRCVPPCTVRSETVGNDPPSDPNSPEVQEVVPRSLPDAGMMTDRGTPRESDTRCRCRRAPAAKPRPKLRRTDCAAAAR